MTLVKSGKRTLLKEDSLSNCLTTKHEGTNITECDPVPAINLWFKKVPQSPRRGGSKENKAG